MIPSLPSSRHAILGSETEQPYFSQIQDFLAGEKEQGRQIYPSEENVLKAFDLTPRDAVKLVILGQDPYHGVGQAMGLSFSVPESVSLPPSLRNIYKELASEYEGYDTTQSGDLTRRAEQGVLLLNTVLTVRAAEAGSHSKIGWQQFTDAVIRQISEQKEGIVFLLRGSYAQSKKTLIDTQKHKILESVHPSPLSAYRGWFGCNHFREANEYLQKNGKLTINR